MVRDWETSENLKMANDLNVLLGEINPENTGRFAGEALVCVIILAGVLKCWRISKRTTTNRKCALSLMMVLISFAGFSVVGMLSKDGSQSPLLLMTVGMLGFAMFGLVIVAVVFAILGLSEYAKQKGVFVQGKAQAIWALALSSLIIFAGLSGFIRGIWKAEANGLKPLASKPGKILEFADYNFRFRTPDHPGFQ
jgi:hypothetical protein